MLIGELIPYLVRYLKDNPAAAEHKEFKHLLVDEFQDLNKAEQTAKSLGIKLGRITSVAENAGGYTWSQEYFPPTRSPCRTRATARRSVVRSSRSH